ncbi:MAG: hypothetical protein SGCHY_004157, partial [Lobulomycetales sp.]
MVRKQYKIETKLECIKYAVENGNSKAAEKWNINKSMVSRWRRDMDRLENVENKECFKPGAGRKPMRPLAKGQ